jgi:hypothetical protein
MEVGNRKAAWIRDGLLFHVLSLLRVNAGPTHDDNDRRTFGDEPYKPAWAAEVPFASMSRADRRLPFATRRLAPTPVDDTHEVHLVTNRRTLLAYDRKSKLLAYMVESRRGTGGETRTRSVAFHPSFNAYTVYDVAMDTLLRPAHRITTRYEQRGWETSARNRNKVRGVGPYVRKWQLAAGRTEFGTALSRLMRMSVASAKGK